MKHEKTLIHAGLIVGFITLLAVPAWAHSSGGGGGGAGKVSFSDLSMSASATKDGHREQMEIASWSLGASSPAAARGNTNVNAGILTLTATKVPASVARLCSSRTVLPSMTIETDGHEHELRNVAFAQCPSGGTTGGVFTLTFDGQTTAPTPIRVPGKLEMPNVTIRGFTRSATQNNLKQMSLGAHSATLYIGSANGGVWKTTNGGAPAPGQHFPEVVIEGRGGTRIAFMNVKLKDILVSSATETQINIEFESTTATPQLVAAIIAGR